MAQKVNPIGIRLTLNRHSESNWFSNYYYSTLNVQDYVVRHYLNNLKRPKGTELGIRTARAVIHHYPKKTQVHLFYLGRKPNLLKSRSYEKQEDNKKWCNPIDLAVTSTRNFIKLSSPKVEWLRSSSGNLVKKQGQISKMSQNKDKLLEIKEFYQRNLLVNSEATDLPLSAIRYSKEFWRQKSICQNVDRMLKHAQNNEAVSSIGNEANTYILDPLNQIQVDSDSIQTLLMRHNLLFMDEPFVWNHLNKALSGETVTMNLVQNKLKALERQSPKGIFSLDRNGTGTVINDFSGFGHKKVSLGAHRRLSLVPIKVQSLFQSATLLAQEISLNLEKKKSFRPIWRSILIEANKLNYIKGIRIACSGRLNGAEIAKVECRKYAATSLHVFSDEIDYGFQEAKTLYGIIGVKVWIAYKKK
jgi:ribosomal protein S3